jgi:hypothetical protein
MSKKMKEIVINKCFGGFGLSDKAYEKLIEWGIPVRKYIEEPRNPKTGLYDIEVPENKGEVIFDKELTPKGESRFNDIYHKFKEISSRYWETWLDEKRDHPLLIKVVKELGQKASDCHANLKIIKIPADVDWQINEYDGLESIHEVHRSWS